MKKTFRGSFLSALLIVCGISFAQQSKTDSLIAFCSRAKQDTLVVNTLNEIGKEYRNTGNYEKAIQFAERSEART